ncbi:hypothetical protein [Acinetobacter sp. P1(2025)]|uniref:hypothetical protein n=1 Tax=Acinetobacter sp. P1(2025) TaxID=3446120 RepID=UPI003F537BD5
MFDTVGIQLFLVALIAALLLILIIKPLRELFFWFIKDIVIPCGTWLMRYVLLFGLKAVKNILIGHLEIAKNMLYPRSIIFVNLDDQRKDRDKAMNRKKGK